MSVGTASLTLPAPSGGVALAISSSDPVATVPASVTVPGGARSIDFPVTTGAAAADTDVIIRASTPSGAVSGTFPVWAVLANFFSYVSDLGDYVGGGGYGRVTTSTAQFTAQCRSNEVTIVASTAAGGRWEADFSAPAGQPLRVGAYENATDFPSSVNPSPGIEVFVSSRGCSFFGRFVVHEVDFAPTGAVNKFWATFEERCQNSPASAFRGDVRVTSPPMMFGPTACLQ
jgi:hypothetical protein